MVTVQVLKQRAAVLNQLTQEGLRMAARILRASVAMGGMAAASGCGSDKD